MRVKHVWKFKNIAWTSRPKYRRFDTTGHAMCFSKIVYMDFMAEIEKSAVFRTSGLKSDMIKVDFTTVREGANAGTEEVCALRYADLNKKRVPYRHRRGDG